MKRILAIPLLILYLTAVSGVMVQIHYCDSKIESWKINDVTSSCCCEEKENLIEGSVGDQDCCSDETFVFKIIDDQNAVTAFSIGLLSLQTAIPASFSFSQIDFQTIPMDEFAFQANAPPSGNWQQIPLFKLYKRYTYYG